ncbi:MarR family winged helix-turn-helix transcriptional regulator [Variovorax ginsengisoli]|uniref:MarR family transcriptional regulator n=1 Tax=Variovorax ginsengisoli TaxID=363844 RepID=A0ABT8SDW2_9BURK|nr:MarR family transcriptional regulator [Variovorax ginsengisoli]MDN8617945.1 MarR family transcriptional regulator [Variovorax ginsengisoli]MDO1537115.1 MarR family transcriptional regulator [Variovorax ginsengisoli]
MDKKLEPRDGALALLAAPIAPLADEYIAVLVMSLAGRLNRGASNYYLKQFDISMVDYRIVLALGLAKNLNISAVAASADVDKAAASRSLRALEQRGVVELEQTATRGRAAIVHLTEAGRELERALKKSSRQRERRFVAGLSEDERKHAVALLKKLIAGVPHMNKE